MLVNTDTLVSLQIFETEDHANISSSIKKEGLSLYSKLLIDLDSMLSYFGSDLTGFPVSKLIRHAKYYKNWTGQSPFETMAFTAVH